MGPNFPHHGNNKSISTPNTFITSSSKFSFRTTKKNYIIPYNLYLSF